MFWRVFAANAAILIAGALALAFAPGPLHKHAAVIDLTALLVGLLVMLVANGLLLRRLFRPLERLAEQMETADVLRGGQRLPVVSPGEIGRLERTFNAMLERLETERREAAGAYALQAQEAERQRLARGLHDEVGQSMTAVLLQLKRLASNATPEQHATLDEAQEVVKASLEDVRRLAQELRPEVLDHLGLASALENLAGSFARRSRARGPATTRARPAAARPATSSSSSTGSPRRA